MKYFNKFIFICFFYVTYSVAQNDTTFYKSLILKHNAFSKYSRHDSDLKITYINHINDTVYLKLLINTISSEEPIEIETDVIIVKDTCFIFGNWIVRNKKRREIIDTQKILKDKETGVSFFYKYFFDKKYMNYSYSTYNDKKNGIDIAFNGKYVSNIYYYKNGKFDGNYSWFYDENKIKEIGKYENGIRTGLYMEFYKDGGIKCIGNYSGNYILLQLDSLTKKIQFSYNGKTKIDFNKKYIMPLKEELGETMRKSSSSFPYKFELKEGSWIYYNSIGQIIKTVLYDKNGDIIPNDKIKH